MCLYYLSASLTCLFATHCNRLKQHFDIRKNYFISRAGKHEHGGRRNPKTFVETKSGDLRSSGIQKAQYSERDGGTPGLKVQENNFRHQGDNCGFVSDELQRLSFRRSHLLLPSWQLLLRQELDDLHLRLP